MDRNRNETFKAQKGSKDIVKIVHNSGSTVMERKPLKRRLIVELLF